MGAQKLAYKRVRPSEDHEQEWETGNGHPQTTPPPPSRRPSEDTTRIRSRSEIIDRFPRPGTVTTTRIPLPDPKSPIWVLAAAAGIVGTITLVGLTLIL